MNTLSRLWNYVQRSLEAHSCHTRGRSRSRCLSRDVHGFDHLEPRLALAADGLFAVQPQDVPLVTEAAAPHVRGPVALVLPFAPRLSAMTLVAHGPTSVRTADGGLAGLPSTLGAARLASTSAYDLTNEDSIHTDWAVVGDWRLEGAGIRLHDARANLTTRKMFGSNVERISFSYEISDNTQMWVSIWGETFVFDPPWGGGKISASIERNGNAVTFTNGLSAPVTVILKKANAGVETPLLIRMDQRNLWRPSMSLLLKSVAVTHAASSAPTTPAAPTVTTALPADGKAHISWSVPSDRGTAVTDYVIQHSGDNGTTWTTFPDGRSTITSTVVTDLRNGKNYLVRVAAMNAAGMGSWSATQAVTPGARTSTYDLSNEDIVHTDWAVVGDWRLEGAGIRLHDARANLTTRKMFGSNVERISFSYEISDNTQMWVSIWGETFVFDPPWGGGKISASIERNGNAVTFTNGLSAPVTVILKKANAGVETPLLIRMDQRNLWRPSMSLLLKSVAVTHAASSAPTTPAAPEHLTAAAGNGRVSLAWKRPASDAGAPISAYQVEYSSDGGTSWTIATSAAGTQTSTAVVGLTNGLHYLFRVAALTSVGVGAYGSTTTTVRPVAGVITPISLTAQANQRLQNVGFGAVAHFPEGDVTLGGVQFAIPVGGTNVWTGLAAVGPSLRVLDVPVNATGVTRVHTLINTLWGERAVGVRASITFFGSAGAVYSVPLDGNVNIRDYLWGSTTNTINGTSTVNVFTTGSGPGLGPDNQVRLDMQTFALPKTFASQTLTRIRIADWGGTNEQRLMVSGISVI